MDAAIIGIGYVGITQAAGLAEIGHTVHCYDINEDRLNWLRRARSPFHEEGLDALLQKNRERIIAHDSIDDAIKKSPVAFLCVGTPPFEDGSANLRYLYSSARDAAKAASGKLLLVEKSTVPAGTAKAMIDIANKYSNGKKVYCAVNPEFLAEGTMVRDFLHPDRIVVGVDKSNLISEGYARDVLTELYAPLKTPIDFTDLSSAELVKHVSNFMLAQRISTTNLVSQLCEKTGADVEQVMGLVGKDKRVGPHFLRAGVGYGGSCFPKDTLALASLVREYGIDAGIIESVVEFNDLQKQAFVRKVDKACGGLEGKTLGILGLAFKPGTDDMRFAPSIDIIKMLVERGADVQAYDPAAEKNARPMLPPVHFKNDAYEAADHAHALVVLTEWPQFKSLDFTRIRNALHEPKIIVDGRNLYDLKEMRRLGFTYYGVGRQ